MPIKIDTEKLSKLIQEELDDMRKLGPFGCVEGEVVIGCVDGIQISLRCDRREEEHEPINRKYQCVSAVKKA